MFFFVQPKRKTSLEAPPRTVYGTQHQVNFGCVKALSSKMHSGGHEETKPLLTTSTEEDLEPPRRDFLQHVKRSKRGPGFTRIRTMEVPGRDEEDGDVKPEARPRAHRERETEHALSNCDTIIHLLKGNIGTGILAMPDAIKNSGLLVGSLGLVIMSIICVNCMHMLVGCAHVLCDRENTAFMTYSDVAESAFTTSNNPKVKKFGKFARRCIDTFLVITQLGFCCVYFVFVSQNIKAVMDSSFGHSISYNVYMAILLVPMLLLVSIRNLKYLSPVSMLANLLQFVGLALTFFYLLQDLPMSWERKSFASWGQLPLYFGTAIYAFEGIGVVLPIENQMRYPRQLSGWNGVLNTAMVIVTCLYIAVGFFGYLKYGEDVAGSITLNLPVDQWLAKIVIIMMSVAIFCSYAIQFYVPVTILLPFFHDRVSERYHLLVEYALRFTMVLFTFALGAAIPKLDLFISLVGAVSSSTLALLAPPIIDTVTHWPDQGYGYSRLIRNVLYFTIGFVGFLTGSYVSISEIVKYFTSE